MLVGRWELRLPCRLTLSRNWGRGWCRWGHEVVHESGNIVDDLVHSVRGSIQECPGDPQHRLLLEHHDGRAAEENRYRANQRCRVHAEDATRPRTGVASYRSTRDAHTTSPGRLWCPVSLSEVGEAGRVFGD